jgi:hypothetical protein
MDVSHPIDLSGHCWSVYDGCLCEYEAGHKGLHACLSPYHIPQFWTTDEALEWIFNEITNQPTKKGGSDEPV